jgi:hypothetical protein
MDYDRISTGQLREMSWDALERIDRLNAEIMAERTRLGAFPGDVVVVGADSEFWSLTQRLSDAWAEYKPLQKAYYERVMTDE